MGRIAGIVLDLDGCIYIGEKPIEGAAESIYRLRVMGYQILFLTNNSTLSRRSYVEKLAKMGITASVEEILTSGVIAARYLARLTPRPRILAVAESGFLEEASELGLEILDLEEWRMATHVVSGLDRSLTYHKLSRACRAILSGASYICTNPDNLYPSGDGYDPGAGSIAAAISSATGVKPIYMGKPYDECVRHVIELMGVGGDRILFVGDRVDTDIALAHRAGGIGVLVRTGLSGVVMGGDAKPDYIIDSVAHLPSLLMSEML
jgi:HAD superfamily hydrolase (TIGR01450 family)